MTMQRIVRRDWMAGVVAGLLPHVARAGDVPELHFEDLEFAARRGLPRRARLLYDRRRPPTRALVLLHGKGEAASERLGLKAWSHLYGLLDAHSRLRTPPVGALLERPKVETTRLERINAELKARPFSGLALICPATPNPAEAPRREALFESYSDWLLDTVVPEARKRVPSLKGRVGIDGCSMGGYVALEVFLRRTAAFSTLGTVQAAIGKWRVKGYVERFRQRFDEYGARPIHLETSTLDPFREANKALSRELTAVGIENVLDVLPGPHNQPWLRQLGTLEMLHWHDRKL